MYRLLPPRSEAGGRGVCTHDGHNVQWYGGGKGAKPGSTPTGRLTVASEFGEKEEGGGKGLETGITSRTEEHENKEDETHGGGEGETETRGKNNWQTLIRQGVQE